MADEEPARGPALREPDVGSSLLMRPDIDISRAGGFAGLLLHVLFRPSLAFGTPYAGCWDRRAALFALAVAALVPAVQQLLAHFAAPHLADVLSADLLVSLFVEPLRGDSLVRGLVLEPLLLPFQLALYAVVLHVLLRLAQGGECGYGGTFQAACYAYGCSVLRIVPEAGAVLAICWWLVVMALGLRLTHRTPWHRILPVMSLHVAAAAWLICIAGGWVAMPL